MLRAKSSRSNARLLAPRTSTPSSVTPALPAKATPRTTLLSATSRSTTLEALERKSKPSDNGVRVPRNRLPPSARFVLPAMTTGFVGEPEKAVVSTTAFVAG